MKYSVETARKVLRQMNNVNAKLATLVDDRSGEFEKQQYRFNEFYKLFRKIHALL